MQHPVMASQAGSASHSINDTGGNMMYFTRKGSDARIKVPTAFNYKKAGHTTTSKDSLLTIMNRTTVSNYVSPLVA